jgi:hypothetical protein
MALDFPLPASQGGAPSEGVLRASPLVDRGRGEVKTIYIADVKIISHG